jgi:hypothetical protein
MKANTALVWDDAAESIVGRNPTEMSEEDFAAAGVATLPPMKAIRAKCVDCSAGNVAEVRRCVVIKCALWPFRLGSNPFREKRVMSEEQKAAAAERLANARKAKETA